jgi:hypothetical protein
MPQFLFKCVKDKKYDIPDPELHLSDLREAVERDPDLVWGFQPGPRSTVRNSDGTTTTLEPKEGFFLKPVEDGFVVCYEHYCGIAIHSPEKQDLVEKCMRLAEALNAKVFRID